MMTNKLFQNLLPAYLVAISLTTLILKIYTLNKQLSEAARMQRAFCHLLASLSYHRELRKLSSSLATAFQSTRSPEVNHSTRKQVLTFSRGVGGEKNQLSL